MKMAIKIKPLGDRVLLEPITEAERTKAGIAEYKRHVDQRSRAAVERTP